MPGLVVGRDADRNRYELPFVSPYDFAGVGFDPGPNSDPRTLRKDRRDDRGALEPRPRWLKRSFVIVVLHALPPEPRIVGDLAGPLYPS
jgi:hypothetical protein